jgi:hypothetical protein
MTWWSKLEIPFVLVVMGKYVVICAHSWQLLSLGLLLLSLIVLLQFLDSNYIMHCSLHLRGQCVIVVSGSMCMCQCFIVCDQHEVHWLFHIPIWIAWSWRTMISFASYQHLFLHCVNTSLICILVSGSKMWHLWCQ